MGSLLISKSMSVACQQQTCRHMSGLLGLRGSGLVIASLATDSAAVGTGPVCKT